MQGLGQRGGLGGLPTLLVALSAGGTHSTVHLLLAPCFCSQFFRSDFRRASLIAQLVKNRPAMQETPVRLLDREDMLEKG